MAQIQTITTPDGVVHTISGSGQSITYSIGYGSASNNTVPLILTGSNGTTDTVYIKGAGSATLSVSGDTLTITTSSGQTITYTFTGSGDATTYTITATPSSGTAQTVTIPAATASAAGLLTSADKTKLNGIASGAEVNVQADWNQTDSSADDYIKNKPTIPAGVVVDSALSTTSANPVENRVITNALNDKVDKETGKGLSTNDFTTAEKNKLAGIQAGAEVNVQADWNVTDSSSDAYIKNKPSIPTATSDLTNDSNFVSDANYVHTDNNFTNADVTKLNGIEAGAEVNVQANWNETNASSDAYIQNKPSLAPVATSGDYDDLSNKPTIPTVNDGTLTIQKNGTTIDTFTANQSGNTTVNVTVPTATSQLTNDSGYLTSESDPVYSASPASGITSSDITDWDNKQDELVSGTNIKTINNESLLGSGNISIGGGSSDVTDVQVNGTSVVTSGIANIQDGDFMTAATRAAWDTRIGTTDATIDQMLAYIVDAMTVKSVTPTLTPAASQYKASHISMFVYGKVVQLHVEPYCTASVGAGDNIYRGSLTPAAYRPISNVLSASYYNAKSYAAMLATDGTLTVRNASPNNHPANGALAITFTYLIS